MNARMTAALTHGLSIPDLLRSGVPPYRTAAVHPPTTRAHEGQYLYGGRSGTKPDVVPVAGELVGELGAPGVAVVRVRAVGKVEDRLHDAPFLVDRVLAREPGQPPIQRVVQEPLVRR